MAGARMHVEEADVPVCSCDFGEVSAKSQRRFVEEDVAGLSGLLKPEGDAHRLTDRMRLGARDDFSRANADADREPSSPAALEFLAEICDALTCLHARAQRTERVVLVDPRDAE